jgi:hypothetical protein
MDRENCLKRRMLHACVRAYHPDPPPKGDPLWREGPLFIDAPAAPLPPLPGPAIDRALVGRIDEGLLIAFRGTLPPLDLKGDGTTDIKLTDASSLAIALDWVNNTHIQFAHLVLDGVTIPGGVHEGYAGSIGRLWDRIAAEVNRLQVESPASHFYFTGHSKGGALANLAAYAARKKWGVTVKVATIGAPHAGGQVFADAYRDAGIECLRYEAEGDKVPTLPAGRPIGETDEYVAVGQRILLSAVAPPPPPPPAPPPKIFGFIPNPFPPLQLPPVPILAPIRAHLPYPGFTYGEHVCEPGCPHSWR